MTRQPYVPPLLSEIAMVHELTLAPVNKVGTAADMQTAAILAATGLNIVGNIVPASS